MFKSRKNQHISISNQIIVERITGVTQLLKNISNPPSINQSSLKCVFRAKNIEIFQKLGKTLFGKCGL